MMIQIAQRTQERANNRAASVAEGWGGWFFGGFSSVSLGLQWLGALVGWIGMTMMGIVCIGLGVGLLGSP
ncbi:MAG: hypothetical protein HYT88_04035 [Candidatus Omnitrophica bacterium]|nr:hypothetical protein [Candidatus Omnitrophota bacterium]